MFEEDYLGELLDGVAPEDLEDIVELLPPSAVESLLGEVGVSEDDWEPPSSPIEFALDLDPEFVVRDHLVYLSSQIAQAVRDVENGQSRRLIIEMPPRSGKTYLATMITTAWILAKHPDWPIMLTSHDGSLAVSWGRRIKRWAEAGLLGRNAALVKDSTAASEWETLEGGVVLSRSVRESITGRGAKCVSADTLIESEYGKLTAEEAFSRGISKIRAYNHVTGRAEFRSVVAAQRKRGGRLLEIVTESGRVLTVTSDHKVYTGRGYVAAGNLRNGEALVAFSDAAGVPLREVTFESDTVRLVRDTGREAEWVYDFQVEGTSNFFADEILVHNCLLIDDPHKDFIEAHSETVRDTIWNWWLSVAQTRLQPPSLVIVTMTRWHENDLVGRLLSDEYAGDPDSWKVIRLPALADEEDILGREVGEPLLSPLLEENSSQALMRWSETKAAVGEYTWTAMYQQSPAPSEGSIFNTEWWRFWTNDPEDVTPDGRVVLLPSLEELRTGEGVDSWDLTFQSSNDGDFVVGQRWVKEGTHRYLLAQERGKWSFVEQLDRIQSWLKTDDNFQSPFGELISSRLVENAANGAAMIDVLRDTVRGIKAIKPLGSKEMRARAVTPEISRGEVFLPHPSMPGYEWVTDLISELRNFPNDRHDDQVDALTQALNYLKEGAGTSSISSPIGRVQRAYDMRSTLPGTQGRRGLQDRSIRSQTVSLGRTRQADNLGGRGGF